MPPTTGYYSDAYAPVELRELAKRPPAIWNAYTDARQYYSAMESAQLNQLAAQDEWAAFEAGSTQDFASFLRMTVIRNIIETYKAVPSTAYRDLAMVGRLEDFRPVQIYKMADVGEILEVPEGADYSDTSLKNVAGATKQLRKYGRLFSLTLEQISQDDSSVLSYIPRALGRQFARLRNKLWRAAFIANPTLYDGRAMFNVTDGNLGSTSLTPDTTGAAALVTAYQAALASMKDENNENIGYRPYWLIVPPGLEIIARSLTEDPTISNAAGTALVTNQGAKTGLKVWVEPSLTDTNDWFLMPNQNEFANVNFDFYKGQQEPTIIQTAGGGRVMSGPNNGMEDLLLALNDTYTYKIRGAMAATPIDRRGTYGSIVP